jgi:ferredoxin--NADP+ reductase
MGKGLSEETYRYGQILKKAQLAPSTKLIRIYHPRIARKVQAGQFFILVADERSERIPLTAAEWSAEEGWIEVIFLEVGYSTKKLGMLPEGYVLMNLMGPLGNPTEVESGIKVAVVGGGVGIANAFPVARAFKEKGCEVHSILGARSADRFFYVDKIRSVSDKLYLCTDDGSLGRKGFVTEQLKDLLESGEKYDLVYAVGPTIMMKVVADVTRPFGVKTIASLNPIMMCGMAMCGVCRVTIGGKVMFACFHGPEFDAHQVDFEELLARLSMYRKEEQLMLKKLEEEG